WLDEPGDRLDDDPPGVEVHGLYHVLECGDEHLGTIRAFDGPNVVRRGVDHLAEAAEGAAPRGLHLAPDQLVGPVLPGWQRGGGVCGDEQVRATQCLGLRAI